MVMMNHEEALALLAKRAGSGPDPAIGPAVDAIIRAIRAGDTSITSEEISAALVLLPTYLDEVQHVLVGAARAVTRPARTPGREGQVHVFTWYAIGQHLGYPPKSAGQRALTLATRVGLHKPRKHDETPDD